MSQSGGKTPKKKKKKDKKRERRSRENESPVKEASFFTDVSCLMLLIWNSRCMSLAIDLYVHQKDKHLKLNWLAYIFFNVALLVA